MGLLVADEWGICFDDDIVFVAIGDDGTLLAEGMELGGC